MFNILRCRPFLFNRVNDPGLAKAEMQPMVGLRRYARTAMDLVDRRASPGDDTRTCTNSGAITFRSDQLELEPVLGVAPRERDDRSLMFRISTSRLPSLS